MRFAKRVGSMKASLLTFCVALLAVVTLWIPATALKQPYRSEAERNADMEDRFNRCGLIVLATIVEEHPQRMDHGIFTRFCVDVQACLRNSHPDSARPCFWTMGGHIGTQGSFVEDLPTFRTGEQWILALPWSNTEPRLGWRYGRHAVATRVVNGYAVETYGLMSESDDRSVEITREVPVLDYLEEIRDYIRVRDPAILGQRCDYVILGRVLGIDEERQVPAGTPEHASITFEVEDAIKGDPGSDRIGFEVLLRQYLFGQTPPDFAVGERCVVFLIRRPDGALYLVGGKEGKYAAPNEDVSSEFRSYSLTEFIEDVTR